MVDQFKMVGGDQIPTLCKNEGEGAAVRMSFLMIARVISVMPRSMLRSVLHI